MNANGDGPDPRTLEKLLGQLKGMAKIAKEKVRRGRPLLRQSAPPKMPRQICDICNSSFDFVVQTEPGIPEISRCTGCKQKLASGLTALVGKPKISGEWLHAWVKGGPFKPGEVLTELSDETMQKVLERSQLKANGNSTDIH